MALWNAKKAPESGNLLVAMALLSMSNTRIIVESVVEFERLVSSEHARGCRFKCMNICTDGPSMGAQSCQKKLHSPRGGRNGFGTR